MHSCKPDSKKEEQHLGPYYFRQYADYFWFKPGTYWIYENNRTGELDTCTLVDIIRDTVTFYSETPNFKRWYTREVIDYNIFTKHRLGIVNYRTARPCMDCPLYKVDSTSSIVRNGSVNYFYMPWNYYPLNSAFLPILNVGDTTYTGVYRFDWQNDAGLPFWDDTKLLWGGQNGSAQYSSYYWARHVGLIQIKYKKNTQHGWDSAYWTLKEKKLIRQ